MNRRLSADRAHLRDSRRLQDEIPDLYFPTARLVHLWSSGLRCCIRACNHDSSQISFMIMKSLFYRLLRKLHDTLSRS